MVEISVIVPVYNCEMYLEECIEGIINQSFRDIEIICVDDGSTDNSLDMLKGFARKDDRIQVYSQENLGAGVARNFAVSKSSGRYLFFMDSDDILYTNALERVQRSCENAKADLLFFKAVNYLEDSDSYFKMDYYYMDKIFESVGDNPFSLGDIEDNIFDISVRPFAKLFRRDLVVDSDAKFGETLSCNENKFFWDTLFNSKRMIFHNEVLYVKRDNVKSHSNPHDVRNFDAFIEFNDIFEIFKKHDAFDRHKGRLYNWKIENLFLRFEMMDVDLRGKFKEMMMNEFLEMNSDGEISHLLGERNMLIYESCLNSNTCDEFMLEIKKYSLDIKLKKLKENTIMLSDKLEETRTKNKELLNSTSWKVTKPLRYVRNFKNRD